MTFLRTPDDIFVDPIGWAVRFDLHGRQTLCGQPAVPGRGSGDLCNRCVDDVAALVGAREQCWTLAINDTTVEGLDEHLAAAILLSQPDV